ncbi:MAG: hypothetical protein JWO47_436 [Candidatus Saccharibacteria bacterium]|nr:hypothetical protein [Candidatus Saccharibacteria bacterium]
MSNRKRRLHHILILLRRVNSFLLLGLCIFFAVMAVLALRSNNQNMVKLRSAVFEADKNNKDIEQSLKNLREYVYDHMNTNLASGANAVKPPIQLKYTFDRLNAANAAAYQAQTKQVLDDAEATCVAQYPGSVFSQPRSECAKAYGAAHPVTQKSIQDDLYKFDFLSPAWSPDQAGWSILAAGFFFMLFVVRVLSSWVIKRELESNS